ncbi:zinc-ribbon-domain-containing protein [Peziza echinospora]|nr:zinc-ribbon-domain-containing protein [Peziza echinospora]
MSLPEGSSQAQTMARRPSNSSTITTAAAAAAAAIPATTTTITPNEETPKTQALPEDDGQKELRSLLKGIYTLPVTEREKAQKMHAVMTERYHALKEKKGHPKTIYPPEKDDPFDVTPQDAEKSYHKDSELGCSHYKRGVKLQCSTCHKWHTCRFCHDEQEDHSLIRRETKNMLCMHCGKAQPAQQDCRHCGVKSARYYCDKCKLWDDDGQKKIYHCDDCGICRIGAGLGKDFFHCKKCGVCMSITLQDSHRCIERSTECDCPICGEFMFTSTMTVVFMPCGHSIHHKCYYEHMKSSYRCPTCARTIVNMESQFRALDIEISSQPLPAPYDNWRCLISCNDCSARSNVSFHFLGLKCEICRSYNTRQIRLIKPEEGGLLGGTSPPVFPVQLAQVGGGGGGAGGDGFGAANTTATRRDATGANTLIAATAAIVQADAAITMVSNSNGRSSSLVYDDGWDDEEGAREGVDGDGGDEDEDGGEDDDDDDERGSSGSWSRCGSDLGDSREEEEGEDDEEDDDFLNLTGHR